MQPLASTCLVFVKLLLSVYVGMLVCVCVCVCAHACMCPEGINNQLHDMV